MEKTTKKKKSKGLKRRIGIIAIGGLSLVLTICLSVGATLAWFAGSTYASNTMYMGGPVYVEMAGRGTAGSTAGSGTGEARWVGGSGNLDIHAVTRETGTVENGGSTLDYSQILLPGQKLLIYSQARVYSTNETTTVNEGRTSSTTSGANTTNTSNGTYNYVSQRGRVTTTTTSVLRAKFSINVEFDPTVGINNFTNPTFAAQYPVQSQTNYKNEASFDGTTYTLTAEAAWHAALGGTTFETTVTDPDSTSQAATFAGRRDAVNATTSAAYFAKVVAAEKTTTNTPTGVEAELTAIKAGTSVSIYKWKYVDATTYNTADAKWQMGKPFDGTVNSAGTASALNGAGTGNGFYGLWVADNDTYTTSTGNYVESDAFYKARTKAYLNSYKETYVDEYGRLLEMGVGASLNKLEESLNESFKDLVNWSSDAIIAGTYDTGFTVDPDTGIITGNSTGSGVKASWLYVDPTTPGAQDTNAGESSTSVGGWWYLVAGDTADGSKLVSTGENKVATVVDAVTGETPEAKVNTPTAGTSFQRAESMHDKEGVASATLTDNGTTILANTNAAILNAKLFEISPETALAGEVLSYSQGNTGVLKTVSISFPFVNGAFALPSRELTNNFANAKITFQITFQALQAFFPYTSSIDSLTSNDALLGTAHALNIKNAIPIYNEAFDYLAYL